MNRRIAQSEKCGKKGGFTLIELLVVIAIISLLVSILLPSLQKARELARQTICMTNLHSFSLAVAQYAHDYNDVYPPSGLNMSPSWEYPHPRWNDALLPYINSAYFGKTIPYHSLTDEFNQPIWWCPSASEDLRLDGYRNPVSYAYNPFLYENNKPNDAARLGNIGGPDKTGVLFDCDNWTTTPWLLSIGCSQEAVNRHNEGGNFLFADGHVARIPQLAFLEYWPDHENEFFYGHSDPDSFWR